MKFYFSLKAVYPTTKKLKFTVFGLLKNEFFSQKLKAGIFTHASQAKLSPSFDHPRVEENYSLPQAAFF